MAGEGKWTKGPYSVKSALVPNDGEYDWAVGAEINGTTYCIAEVFGRVAGDIRPNAQATATLFAAALDLYEALNAALALISDNADEIGALVHPDTVNAVCDMARAALARAGSRP